MGYRGLIAALGNPGRKYTNTRHNAGFMAANILIRQAERTMDDAISVLTSGKCWDAWEWTPGSQPGGWLIVEPQTYMNLSGDAICPLMRKNGLHPGQLLVVHDELDLAFGRLQFRTGGGLAGHKGLKSIVNCLGSREFHRLRIGIGRPLESDVVTDYVLESFSPGERAVLPQILEAAAEGVRRYCLEGPDRAMQYVNSLRLVPGKDE